uniref:Uncharacterized protein n=1 Tax=Rhizophagus irregularis (strain DAOM 181602 / DAOM 197198 / MUCL 43194) TaxID=747089 RepID=U9UQE0_RHIID
MAFLNLFTISTLRLCIINRIVIEGKAVFFMSKILPIIVNLQQGKNFTKNSVLSCDWLQACNINYKNLEILMELYQETNQNNNGDNNQNQIEENFTYEERNRTLIVALAVREACDVASYEQT